MSKSARKIKLQVQAPKPRNPMVVHAATRKAGEHRRSKSGERQAGEKALRKALKDV